MKPTTGQRYLEVTFRRGRAMAAYLYLPRRAGDTVESSRELGDALVVDYSLDGRVIGLDIVDPAALGPEEIVRALRSLGVTDVTSEEFRPLAAA